MRLVLFLQVILLFALAGYVLLVQLENPVLVRLPVPGSEGVTVPLGVVVACALGVGALYAGLLVLPGVISSGVRRAQERRERRELEAKLSTTLQAKFAHQTEPTLLTDDDALAARESA